MILFTGAIVNFGGNVAFALQKRNILFQAAAQVVEDIKEKLGSQVNSVAFNWYNPQISSEYLQGIWANHMISSPFKYPLKC